MHFYTSAYKSVKHKSANMDVLIVVSTSSAWLYGVVLIFVGYTLDEQRSSKFKMMIHSHVHNWETSSILILIVLLGKYIESYSKMKTVDKLSDLASLKVTKANLLSEKDVKKLSLGCKFSEIPVELLEIKDFVLVQPGGAVPTDGVVVFGRGMCNESMLTGEAAPIIKEIGLKVFGGTILTQGTIIVKIQKTSENATFN
jgi:Cu+-exporting ATPase